MGGVVQLRQAAEQGMKSLRGAKGEWWKQGKRGLWLDRVVLFPSPIGG